MSTSRKATDYRVRWVDLLPWLSQLKDDHLIDVTFTVTIPQAPGGLKPAVVMTATRNRAPLPPFEVKRDYRCIDLWNIGQVEREALHMVSTLLLECENIRAEMERKQASLWD